MHSCCVINKTTYLVIVFIRKTAQQEHLIEINFGNISPCFLFGRTLQAGAPLKVHRYLAVSFMRIHCLLEGHNMVSYYRIIN